MERKKTVSVTFRLETILKIWCGPCLGNSLSEGGLQDGVDQSEGADHWHLLLRECLDSAHLSKNFMFEGNTVEMKLMSHLQKEKVLKGCEEGHEVE